MPAFGVALKLAKPANVPSFGARSGGDGSPASDGVRNARIMPVEGTAASSVPEVSLARSGAVSATRSCSIFHLNLSQPLGSSAAKAGPNNAGARETNRRVTVITPRMINPSLLHEDHSAPARRPRVGEGGNGEDQVLARGWSALTARGAILAERAAE